MAAPSPSSHDYRNGRLSLHILTAHNIEWPNINLANINLANSTSQAMGINLLDQPYTGWGIGIRVPIASATLSSPASDIYITQQHTRHTPMAFLNVSYILIAAGHAGRGIATSVIVV